MGILLNGYDLKKGLWFEKKFYIEIRETALKKRLSHHRRQHQKNAYYILRS